MHVGHKNLGYSYTMSGARLGVTKEERDIGITASDNLRPSAQCKKAASPASAFLVQISRAFQYRERFISSICTNSMWAPPIQFTAQARCPWTQHKKEALERVQKSTVGMVSSLKGGSYEQNSQLGLTRVNTLEERRHQSYILQAVFWIRIRIRIRMDLH